MKVLLIASTLGERSGWGRLAKQLAEHLRSEGIEVTACVESGEPSSVLRPFHGRSLHTLLINMWSVWRASKNVDIIQTIDGWPYAVYAVPTSIVRRKPLYVCGVGTYSVAPLRSGIKGLLLRRAYMRAREILCISTYTRDRILEHVPGVRASVVHMGTTVFDLRKQEIVDALRKKMRLEEAFPIILTVGRIQDRKDQKSTLRAAALLKKKYPHIGYVMVGSDDDSYAQELKELATDLGMADKIRIVTDVQDNASLAAFYQLCDLTALNSFNDKDHFEGFGLVIVEGYQFGKPAVGSRDCGIEDAIDDGITGYLAKQADPADIAEKMSKAIEGREFLAEGARDFAKTFSWREMARAYHRIYMQDVLRV